MAGKRKPARRPYHVAVGGMQISANSIVVWAGRLIAVALAGWVWNIQTDVTVLKANRLADKETIGRIDANVQTILNSYIKARP